MKKLYTSFLTVVHPEHTDLYVNGFPLAILKEKSVELTAVNPINLPGCAFEDEAQIRSYVAEMLSRVEAARAPTGSHASAVAEPATEGADASVDKAFEDLWFSEPFFSGIGVPLSAKEIARQRFHIAVASITAREASMRERLKEALSELEKRDELDRFSVSQNEILTARLKEAEAKLAEPGIAEYVALKERVNKAEKLAEEWKRSDNLHTQTLHEVGDILSGRKNTNALPRPAKQGVGSGA